MNIRRILRFIFPVIPFMFAAPAHSAEVQSQVGLAISEPALPQSTFQGASGDTVSLDVKKAFGVSTRTTVYWTPYEGRSTNYNLGLSLGYTSGFGKITSSAIVDGQKRSGDFDTQFEYAGLGFSNGFLLKLNRKTQMAFDLGLDLLPLTASYKVESKEGTKKYSYLKAISWHVQIASYFSMSRETDFSISSRYEMTKLFDSKGDSVRMNVAHINLGFRYKFVSDANMNPEVRQKRRVRTTSRQRRDREVAYEN
ncbi:MAG: hypothetical protein FJY29_02840 [Betaproteobacteria bacterium]|nr:hypothetical protein [Betaproteobacteria bacterium]